MAAIDFPNSPTPGQTFTAGNRTWTWDGTAWNMATMTDVLTTKGDLLTRTSTTVTRLAAGTNGQVLTVDSTTDEGIDWLDPDNQAFVPSFLLMGA